MQKNIFFIPIWRKTLATLLLGILTIPFCYAEKPEITLLNWSDYIDPALIAEFQEEKQVIVKQKFYSSDDDRDDILQDANAEGFDVVIVNGANINSYIKRGWAARIPDKEIPNRKHINPRFLKLFPDAAQYAVPYFWGTLGIAYRSDLVNKTMSSWNDIFKPTEDMHNKIAMLGSSRDLVGMALKAHGYSVNSESKQELKAAENLIQQQAPYVKSYSYISLLEDSGLVTGEIVTAMVFSGDALVLKEFNENIQYVVPIEGGNVWVDFILVLSQSTNKKLAMEFINFLNEPKNAARQAEFVYYPTPNQAAEKFLPEDFLNNPEIYPSKDVLEKSESYKKISPRAMKKRHEIFSRVRK